MGMTKLEAVNVMLESAGESAVNSLDSGLDDAERAEALLDEIKDDILEKGWHINTEVNYRLAKDTSGKVAVPSTTLRVDTVGEDAILNVVPRKDGSYVRLYDLDAQTFVLDRSVLVDMVLSYDFADLPRAYQKYIAIEAAIAFQQRFFGSVTLDAFLTAQRDRAWAAMLDAEASSQDDNILRDSTSVRNAAWRNNRLALR